VAKQKNTRNAKNETRFRDKSHKQDKKEEKEDKKIFFFFFFLKHSYINNYS